MDAANVDLKGFSEDFYKKLCAGELQPVLETLLYLKWETAVWFEITNLIIPGWNDSEAELEAMTQWLVENLGPDVPLHFSAFHPDFKMLAAPRTPPATWMRARDIALKNGIRYAYTGNIHHRAGDTTFCHNCGEKLIERDWYDLQSYKLTADGRCPTCAVTCAGLFEAQPGQWGRQRQPVRLANFR
jgi:pyruvate formate lyase activating enzyme